MYGKLKLYLRLIIFYIRCKLWKDSYKIIMTVVTG